MDEAQAQLDGFLDKYDPEVAALARTLLERMKARIPARRSRSPTITMPSRSGSGRTTGRAGVLSIAVYPSVVRLFFLHGKALADPPHAQGGQPLRSSDDVGRPARYPRVDACHGDGRSGGAPIDPSAATHGHPLGEPNSVRG